MIRISETPTPFLVHCYKDDDFGSCGGSYYLTEEEYNKQLMDVDRGWRCPNCNAYPVNWDDANYEKRIDEFNRGKI